MPLYLLCPNLSPKKGETINFMSHKTKKKSNINLAIAFMGLVVFLVVLSFMLKAFWVFKESKFDGSDKFNVAIYDKRGMGIISFSPKEKSISILKLDKSINGNAFNAMQILVNGELSIKEKEFNYSNISASLFAGVFTDREFRKNLTFFDILRLLLYARTVSPNFIFERTLSKQLSDTEKFSVLTLTFRDPAILTEAKSIEVINATEVSGLGNRLANVVSYMGGNVVLVSSKENTKISKIIYFDDTGYTVKKLSSYLVFPAEKGENSGLADIIIIIGEDSLNKLKF